MLWALLRRTTVLSYLRQHDLVFLYEEAARIGPAFLERLIRLSGVPLIYDFCDPVYLPYVSPVNKALSYLKCFSKYATICQLSTQVIAGNRFLEEFARKYNSHVRVIPITIHTEQYTPRNGPKPGNGVPVIGWSGSHTTNKHLEALEETLLQLKEQTPFQLKVISSEKPMLKNINFTYVPWKAESEVEDLRDLDIGIMPLPDDPWTRFRTHLKVRQYMSLGIPVVGSPVGIMSEIVEAGSSGFLAKSPEEWIRHLRHLLEDKKLRRTMGQAARLRAEEHFSAAQWVPQVRDLLETALVRSGNRLAPFPGLMGSLAEEPWEKA
jgi:glycosyltransferase involved in cell wall biosynthesis